MICQTDFPKRHLRKQASYQISHGDGLFVITIYFGSPKNQAVDKFEKYYSALGVDKLPG